MYKVNTFTPVFASFLLAFVLLSSCKLDRDDYAYGELSATSAVNAVPSDRKLDIGLDQNKLNMSNESFGFGDYLPYRNAFPGNRLVRVFDRDSVSKGALVSKQLAFGPGKIYSLFVVGETSLDVVSFEDKNEAPMSGTASVRFINLSPDAPALNLGIEGGEVLLAKSIAYKGSSVYFAMKAGQKYRLFITSNTNAELANFEFVPKEKGIYTIWAKGLVKDREPDSKYKFGQRILQQLE